MPKKEAPKSLRKLSITDKKKFIDLVKEGANTNAFFAYLALNQGEVDYLKENISSLEAEVRTWEKNRAEKLKKDQAEATRLNDLAKDTGSLIDDKSPAKPSKWMVPHSREGEFLHDAARRTIDYMKKKWCNSKEAIVAEITRLETKK